MDEEMNMSSEMILYKADSLELKPAESSVVIISSNFVQYAYYRLSNRKVLESSRLMEKKDTDFISSGYGRSNHMTCIEQGSGGSS